MKTVEFAKAHNYGGIPYEKGDKLECPDDRAEALIAAGVVKKPQTRKSED